MMEGPIAPSRLFVSRGASQPRKYDAHSGFDHASLHVLAAIVTDFDQDGFANELLLLIQGHPPVVYEWGTHGLKEVDRWDGPVQTGWDASVQTGDFDGDGRVDLVMSGGLHELYFYNLQKSKVPEIVDVRALGCDQIVNLHAADFNLDGKVNLLVTCAAVSNSLLLHQNGDGQWTPMVDGGGSLGALSNLGAVDDAWFASCCSDMQACAPQDELVGTGQYLGGTGQQYDGYGGDLGELCNSRRCPWTSQCNTFNNDRYEDTNEDATLEGSSAFDFNNDGFMDLAVCIQNMQCHLLKNGWASTGNKYIAVQLKGTQSNS